MPDGLSSPPKCLFATIFAFYGRNRRAPAKPVPGFPSRLEIQRGSDIVCNNEVLECSWVANFDSKRVERFQQATREKLRGLRCPEHNQPPRLHFSGSCLREMTITMSGCCEKLMQLANVRIASAVTTEGEVRRPA